MSAKIVLFANHNNGYAAARYLSKRSDAEIVNVIVYEDTPGQWWKSVKDLSIKKKLPYHIYRSDVSLYHMLKSLRFDYIISVNWRHLIPLKVISIAAEGGVNLHNSLLPEYKGVFAATWPILEGKTRSGVTLHRMSGKFDDGYIIGQEEFVIDSWDTAWDVWNRANDYSLILFKRLWPHHRLWKKMSTPQKGKSSYYSVRDFRDTNKLNLSDEVSAKDVINFLRAKSFLPHYKNAYFIKDGKKIYISVKLTKES